MTTKEYIHNKAIAREYDEMADKMYYQLYYQDGMQQVASEKFKATFKRFAKYFYGKGVIDGIREQRDHPERACCASVQ